MTFYEAAVEILRSVGRPLHYKKITEFAIKQSLLSHIGKTPELTMGTRLNQEIRKDDGSSLVIRNRPGVFALRAWHERSAPDRIQETVCLATPESTETPEPPPVDASPSSEDRRRSRRRRRSEREQEESQGAPKGDAEQQAVDDGEEKSSEPVLRKEWTEAPVSRGEGLEDAIYRALQSRPYRTNLSLAEIRKLVPNSELHGADNETAEARIHATMVLDNVVAKLNGRRAKFLGEQGWHLNERGLPDSVLTKEQGLLRLSEGLLTDAENTVSQHILDLPVGALHLLLFTLLERMGYSRLAVVQDFGGEQPEPSVSQQLTAQHRTGPIEMTAFVVLRHTDANVCRSDLAWIRERAVRYEAHQALLLVLGDVAEDLLQECTTPGLIPVIVLDRAALARQMVRCGLGVRDYQVPVTLADPDFFRRLTSPGS